MNRTSSHSGARRIAAAAGLAMLLTGFSNLPALAVRAQPDMEFVEQESAKINTLVQSLLPQATTPGGAFEAASRILAARNEALQHLNGVLPLTTFDGIVTQDHFDNRVVEALARVVDKGRAAEGDEPPQEDAIYFSVILGELPPLGKAPVGFMVLQHANMAAASVEALDKDPAITGDNARKLALRLMERAISQYEESHVDDFARHQSDGFHQSSVIVRLRCPTDNSTYRIVNQKNKMGAAGEMSTLYYLKSNSTYEELVLEFPLSYLTRLNQASELQELKEAAQPVNASRDLDP